MLWGLWNIPMWGYYWGYTAAQIELMAVDCPITVYNHKDKRNKKTSLTKLMPTMWSAKPRSGAINTAKELTEYR